VIRVKKKRDTREFYDDNKLVAFYIINKGYVDILSDNIPCDGIRIYQNDFNIFSNEKILSFIKQYFPEELANKIYIYILKDLVYEVI